MAGFFSSLFGGGNTASGYAKKQKKLIDRNTALVDTLTNSYKTAAAGGAFDPNAKLDQLKADTEYQTGINTGNAAAAARTMGYRPGDSEPLLAQRAIGEKATLDYDRMANDIRQQALEGGLGAASNLAGQSSNILGQSLSANGQMLQSAQAEDAAAGAGFGNLLGAALPFLAPGAGVASKAIKGVPFYKSPAFAKSFGKDMVKGVAGMRF